MRRFARLTLAALPVLLSGALLGSPDRGERVVFEPGRTYMHWFYEGLPAQFRAYVADDRFVAVGEPVRGELVAMPLPPGGTPARGQPISLPRGRPAPPP